MRERDREKEIVAPFILIAPKKIIISYYLVFVSGHDELKMEQVENPDTKASYRKRLKSWGYIWTRWKEKKPTGPVIHLMHAGWDTRSESAQRLPAGPDRPSLGWWALNRSAPGKNKSLFLSWYFLSYMPAAFAYIHTVLPAHPLEQLMNYQSAPLTL